MPRYIHESDADFQHKVDCLEPVNVCKNKFNKRWFNCKNKLEDPVRPWLRKTDEVGKAQCTVCLGVAGVISYGSSGKKRIMDHANSDKRIQNMNMDMNMDIPELLKT